MDFLQKILEYDTELFLNLNSYHNDFWDTIMLMITRKETWIPFFAAILYFVLKNHRGRRWMVVLFIALTILLSDQISVLLKETIQRLRPVYNPEIESMVHNVLRKGGLYGFVSSHAANSFALLAFMAKLFKNRSFNLLFLFWTIIFCYSRIYCGVHYPLDILGGAVLGFAIGTGTFALMLFVEKRFISPGKSWIKKAKLTSPQSGMIFLVFAVLSATVLIMASILHKYNYL